MIKAIIFAQESIQNLQDINSEVYNNFKENYNKFTHDFLKDNIFDTVLNYFLQHELMAQLWAQYFETDGSLPSTYNDKYIQNWENNDNVKKLQRLFWGMLLDFRHPLTGQKYSINEWMSFELHHWKTAGGHENKFECFWSAVIPLPSEGTFGHTWVGNQVRDGQGGDMEKMFKDAINAILKGDAPKDWSPSAKLAFKGYSNSIGQVRELINRFLAQDFNF